ncbi:MAG TPA: hypothetical protein PKH46_06000 [Candidatus Cryosericum sp.]|nr:hypothetical protein [Candidatus Cryosericum sp.]
MLKKDRLEVTGFGQHPALTITGKAVAGADGANVGTGRVNAPSAYSADTTLNLQSGVSKQVQFISVGGTSKTVTINLTCAGASEGSLFFLNLAQTTATSGFVVNTGISTETQTALVSSTAGAAAHYAGIFIFDGSAWKKLLWVSGQ